MAILTKGTTFADGDQVTSTRLNNLVDSAAFVAGASGSTDDATLEVASGKLRVKTIQTGNIANLSVTTVKIADSTGTVDGVTTPKLATGAVTTVKIADANVTAPKMSGAQTGSAPVYGVRAWASFDGTASSPITANASGNVASITRTGVGVYSILFTQAMPDVNYAVCAGSSSILQTNSQAFGHFATSSVATTGFTLTMPAVSTSPSFVSFMVIR